MTHLITGNKFDPNKDIPDLSGKVYIVTGGTAGIGYGITAHLLQHNASRIILVSQKEEHAQAATEALKEYGDTNKVHWVQCDLKDLKKTNEVAQDLTKEERIDAVRVEALRWLESVADEDGSSFVTLARVWVSTMKRLMVSVCLVLDRST